MEQFLNALADRIKDKRAQFEAEGLTGDVLTEKTAEWFNAIMMEYYTRLMAVMTEEDFEAYKRATDRQDAEAFQSVVGKYQSDIASLQGEILESLK